MANQLFNLGRQGFADGSIAWGTGTIKVSLVRGYTLVGTHQFLSDVTTAGGTLVATKTLATKTVASGVLGAANVDFPLVTAGAAIPAYIIYQSSLPAGGADVATTAQRLIAYCDDIETVTCAALAAAAATSVAVDPLTFALASGATVVFGGVTVTLTAAAAAGARTLTVSATSGSIAQGVVGISSAQGGMPVTPTGVDVLITWDTGVNAIAKL